MSYQTKQSLADQGQPSNPDLSATEVIAIGAVCAAILIVLLCVLVYFICRRRQNNAAKDYENAQNANRQTQPVNGNIPAKPKRGFDNPDLNSETFNKQTDSSFHGTTRKDQQQYIDLHPEDHKEGGSFGSGMESGYSTPDSSSKPKKVIYEVVV